MARAEAFGIGALRSWALGLMLILALVLILGLAAPAQAQTRHAFVVGIDTYDNVTPLAKARNDATAVAGALEEIGFNTHLLIDADETTLLTDLTRFSGQLDPGDEVVFYFAGHGVEIEGRNYLLPADVPSVAPGQELVVTRGALPVRDVIALFNARGVRLSLLILDACRDNPFERLGTRSLGRSVGLGREEAPEGTFVMFSAGAGQQALDRLSSDDPNPNSVFTRVLLPRLSEPGLPLRTMVREVRSEVRALGRTVAHEQFPAVYDQLDGAFTFVPEDAAPEVAVVTPEVTPQPQAPVTGDPCEAARADWALMGETPSATLLYAFTATHGNCMLMVALASDRLAALNATAPAQTPEPVPAPVPRDITNFEDPQNTRALVEACVQAAHPDHITLDALAAPEAQDLANDVCGFAWAATTLHQSPEDPQMAMLAGRIEHAVGRYASAAEIYTDAASAGNAFAATRLGEFYAEGQGVAQSNAEAAIWFQRASDAGNAEAARRLGVLYFHGRGVAQDQLRASNLFRQAAEGGDAVGIRNVGVMYRNGIGTAVNHAEAMRWFEAGVAAGDDLAHYYVGWQHQFGNGVPVNPQEAARWFLSGLAAGNDYAIENPETFNGPAGRALQVLLRDAGYYTGPIDGAVGPGTTSAMQAYLDAN